MVERLRLAGQGAISAEEIPDAHTGMSGVSTRGQRSWAGAGAGA